MEKAKEQLQYAGIHTLFDSLHQLEIDESEPSNGVER
jgi:hypothetical protein